MNKFLNKIFKFIKKYYILLIFIFILIFFIFIYKSPFNNIKKLIFKRLRNFYFGLIKINKKNKMLMILYIIIFQFFFILLLLPFYIFINSIICFVIKDIFYSTFIIILSSMISTFLLRILIKVFLKNYFVNYFKNNKYYLLINSEIKYNPFKINMMIRFCSIPFTLKEYILSVSNLKEKNLILTGLIYYLYCSIQGNIIAWGISSINDIFNNNYNKFSIYKTFLFLINFSISIIVSIILSKLISKKFK